MAAEASGTTIPVPPAHGSAMGEWKEVRDAISGELLAYGRRIDAAEARRLGRAMRSMPTGASGAELPLPDPGFDPRARCDVLFDGEPMPPGHYHFALALDDGESPSTEPDAGSRVERRRTERAERKASRSRSRTRVETSRTVEHARASRKAQRRAGVRRSRTRGRRSPGRRR